MTPEQVRREEELSATVLASFEATPDVRLRTVLTSLTEHLHAFVREVRLSEDEWQAAIDFLTATGHITDERRQEFILLSDVLGISMQTVTVNNAAHGEATESTVVGPFFAAQSPRIENGDDLAAGAPGEPCWVEGTVTDTSGRPVSAARLDVWEADDEGRYDVQYSDGRTTARAHLFTDRSGAYRFWALTPTPYPIPDDGPVGALLKATNRSPMRVPHLHFKASADGLRTLVTHAFVRGAELAGDSVFGVRESLVRDFQRLPPDAPTPDGRVIESDSWTRARFDIVLAPLPG